MVKQQAKFLTSEKNPINYTLQEYKKPPKSRQQIYQENYQKNKEKKKQLRKERYQQDKERIKTLQKQKYQQQKLQTRQTEHEQLSKYYGAEAFKVLMSFKKYTELNPEKRQLWLDFNWTLKDCQESIKEGYADIVAIMKLEQVAGKLVRDYWETAKSEKRRKSKSWNILDYDEQQRLIKYWGYEKARIENDYIDEEERLERQSQEYLKEIELAKFHEERGKKGCKCWQCGESKKIQGAIKKRLKEDYDQVNKEECPNCGRMVKELDEENGICKRCVEDYE